MEYCTEVCKIIEAGLQGDKAKLLAYANLIADKVKDAGEERQHRMLSRAIDPTLPKGAPAVLDNQTYNSTTNQWEPQKSLKDTCKHPNIGTAGGADYCTVCGKVF